MTDTPLKKRVPQRCTLKELEEAVSYFRIAPATIERVQRVLVDGEAVSVVARGDNLTYQPLARTCNKVMDKVEELRSNAPVLVPPGWEEATIVAPVEFIAETRKRLERYLLDKGWKKSIARCVTLPLPAGSGTPCAARWCATR